MTTLASRPLRSSTSHTIPHRLRPAVRASALVLTAMLVASLDAFAQPPGSSSASDDPFAARSWQLELSAHSAVEAWNYNISHEEIYGGFAGLSYGVRDGLALTAGAPLFYVSQRGVDAWVLGATFGVRGRICRRHRTSVFLGFEVGISEADTFVPPRGTRFNYLALGSAGMTVRVRRSVHVVAALKWIHLSNNGLAGRQRNPDIEALGPQLALLIGF